MSKPAPVTVNSEVGVSKLAAPPGGVPTSVLVRGAGTADRSCLGSRRSRLKANRFALDVRLVRGNMIAPGSLDVI